jgi:hypothetical protein
MNSLPTSANIPEPAPASGEAVALAYIAQELPKARKALRRTQILGVALLCVVAAYISVITLMLTRFFQPKEAAQVAAGMLIQRIDSGGPLLTKELESQIPRLIRQAPEYVLAQLPVYRADLEKRVEADFQVHCDKFNKEFGAEIDRVLDEHKTEIRSLIEGAHDRTALRKALPDFEQAVKHFLTRETDGRVISQSIAELAKALKDIEKRMDRLANGTNLTPEEQTARRSLAMLAKAIRSNTEMPAVTANSAAAVKAAAQP